jgi:hypothetical protein
MITHCVTHAGLNDDYVRAICGKVALFDSEDNLTDGFDCVLDPDPQQLTDCMPCLEQLAQTRFIEKKTRADQ